VFTIARTTVTKSAPAALGFQMGTAPSAAASFTGVFLRKPDTFWITASGTNVSYEWADTRSTMGDYLGWDATDDPASGTATDTLADRAVQGPFFITTGRNVILFLETSTERLTTVTPASDSPRAPSCMGWVRRADGVHLYGALEDDASNSAAAGRLLEFETGTYDQATPARTRADVTYASGTATISGNAGDFSDIAVGASAKGNTDVTNGTTVLSRADDGSSIVLSANTTGAGTATLVFYGAEVHGPMYFTTDHGDAIGRKLRVRKVVPLYKSASGVMSLSVSIDALRVTETKVELDDTGALEHEGKIVKLPLALRGPAEVFEPGFYHDGGGSSRPEVWGLEAELELLNTRGS
jgi:hypothetical protein